MRGWVDLDSPDPLNPLVRSERILYALRRCLAIARFWRNKLTSLGSPVASMERFSRVLATAWKLQNLICFSKKVEIECWLVSQFWKYYEYYSMGPPKKFIFFFLMLSSVFLLSCFVNILHLLLWTLIGAIMLFINIHLGFNIYLC